MTSDIDAPAAVASVRSLHTSANVNLYMEQERSNNDIIVGLLLIAVRTLVFSCSRTTCVISLLSIAHQQKDHSC